MNPGDPSATPPASCPPSVQQGAAPAQVLPAARCFCGAEWMAAHLSVFEYANGETHARDLCCDADDECYYRGQRTPPSAAQPGPSPAAPTPEYVAGWLARGEADAKTVEEAHHELMAPSKLSCDFFARRIRALAPPSAPPSPEGASNDRLRSAVALVIETARQVTIVSDPAGARHESALNALAAAACHK